MRTYYKIIVDSKSTRGFSALETNNWEEAIKFYEKLTKHSDYLRITLKTFTETNTKTWVHPSLIQPKKN